MSENSVKIVKTAVRFVVGGLVEIFVGALTNNVVGGVEGTRAAKLGAKAGGFLVGMYIGDQVSDYICDGIDEITGEIGKLQEAVNENEE